MMRGIGEMTPLSKCIQAQDLSLIPSTRVKKKQFKTQERCYNPSTKETETGSFFEITDYENC